MSNTRTQGRKAEQLHPQKVAEALYHDIPVEHRGWLIRINSKTDTIEVFPPKGDTRHQAFETDLCHLDRAVKDFCKLAEMPIPGINKYPKDQVSVGSPKKLLGPDSSVGEGWKNPKINERPTGLDQKGTSAPSKNLGVDTSSQNVPHFNPAITKRPKDPVGRGGLPDTSLGEDSSSAPTHWRDRIVKIQEDGRTGRREALHPVQKPRRGPGQLGYGKAQMGEEAAPMVDGSGPSGGVVARRRADSDPFDVTPVEEPGKKLNKGEDPSDPKEVITTEQGEGEELRTESEGQHDKEGRFEDSFQFPKVDASEAYRQMTARRPSAELLKDILDPHKWAAGNLMDPAGTFDGSDELELLPDEDMPGPVEDEDGGYFEPDADELVLYITNDNDLYERNLMPIVKNLMRKVKNGTFDETLSVKLWGYLAEAGAQKYAKEMEGSVRPMPWHKLFPTAVRQQAAQQLAEHYNPAILHGEFGDVWPKAGQANLNVEAEGDVEGCSDGKKAVPPSGVAQGVFQGSEDVPPGAAPVRGRRQAGPRLRENWGAAGEYGRDLEAESGEELHALTLALGGQEVDWSRFRPTMPEGGVDEEGGQKSTQPESPKAQGEGAPAPAPAAPAVTAQMQDEFEEEAAEGGLGFFNLRDAYDYYTGMFGAEAPEWSAQDFQRWCSKTLRHKRPEDYTQEDMNAAYEASLAGSQMPGVAASKAARLDPNAFMQPNIEEGDWVIVNGNYGGEVIPADLVDMAEIQKMQKSLERGPLDFVELPGTDLQQYTQNDELYEIEVKHGFGARLSAPGYMDATDWDFFETEEEAMAYLEEQYGDDFEEEAEEAEETGDEHLASRRRAGPADFIDPNEPKPQGSPTDEFLHAEGNPPVDEGQQMTPGSPVKQGGRQAGGFYDESEGYDEKSPQSVADNYVNGNWEDVTNAIDGNLRLAFEVLEMLPPESHNEYIEFVKKVAGKEAVDEKAKDYWGGYFGEYGKDLTEEKKLTKPPSGKSKKKEDPKEARRQAALRARKLAQAAAPIAQPAPPAQSPTNPPASGAAPATPGAPAAPKPAPGAPGAAPMPPKSVPGSSPMPSGSGDSGLQALGWTAEEISLMDEEDKKKILQIKLSKPGSNSKPKTPGADQKGPAAPAGPGGGPAVPTIPPSPLAPTPGNVPAGATPAPAAPKPTAAVQQRLAAMILKKVERRRAIRAQVTPAQSADPNMTPPVGTSTAAQPGAPTGGPTAPPGKSAPGAAATPPKGPPSGSEGSADQKAFDILQEVQQAPVSAASPEQVLSAKVSELARRLLTEIGMTTSDAKQLFGIPSDGGLDKLFQ